MKPDAEMIERMLEHIDQLRTEIVNGKVLAFGAAVVAVPQEDEAPPELVTYVSSKKLWSHSLMVAAHGLLKLLETMVLHDAGRGPSTVELIQQMLADAAVSSVFDEEGDDDEPCQCFACVQKRKDEAEQAERAKRKQ